MPNSGKRATPLSLNLYRAENARCVASATPLYLPPDAGVPALRREIAPKPAFLGTFDPRRASRSGKLRPWRRSLEGRPGALPCPRWSAVPGAAAPCYRLSPRRTRPAPRARLPETKPLGEALDEHIDQCKFGPIAAGKPPIFRPQPLHELRGTPVRLNRGWPRASANSAVISCVESPRAYMSTASASSSSVRPRMISQSRRSMGRRIRSRPPPSSAAPRSSHCNGRCPALGTHS